MPAVDDELIASGVGLRVAGQVQSDVTEVVKAGHTLTEAQVLAHCNARTVGFKAPKPVVFVDALPWNPSGKLLKQRLRQAHAELFGSA